MRSVLHKATLKSSRHIVCAIALHFIPSCCRPKHSPPNSTSSVVSCRTSTSLPALECWLQQPPSLYEFPKQQREHREWRSPLPFLRGFSKLDLSLLCKANIRYVAQQVPSIKGHFWSRPNHIDRMSLMLPYNQSLLSFLVGAAEC